MEIPTKCNNRILKGLSVDSFLGDSSQRYFGNNYKKVSHLIKDMMIREGELYANYLVQWPENWSEKNGASLQPHISTLDFFLIAAILTEAYFRIVRKIHESQISNMWISEFGCKVGNKCITKNTNHCKCQLISEVFNGNRTELSLAISIDDAKVVLKILLPYKSEKNSLETSQHTYHEYESYYISCYKNASRDIKNIEVNVLEKLITASI